MRASLLHSPLGRVGLSGPERVKRGKASMLALSQCALLPPRSITRDPPGERVKSNSRYLFEPSTRFPTG